MHEHVLTGISFALVKVDGAVPPAPTWRLIVVDAAAGPDGNPVPGTGSGDLYSIMLDDAAVATLHEQSAGASSIVVPAKPAMAVVRSRNGK